MRAVRAHLSVCANKRCDHQGVVCNVYMRLVGCLGGCLPKPRGNGHLASQHKLGQLLSITHRLLNYPKNIV